MTETTRERTKKINGHLKLLSAATLLAGSCAAHGHFSYCFTYFGGGGDPTAGIYMSTIFGVTDEYQELKYAGQKASAWIEITNAVSGAFFEQTGHGATRQCGNRNTWDTLQEARQAQDKELKILAEMGWTEVKYINPPCEHRFIYCPPETDLKGNHG